MQQLHPLRIELATTKECHTGDIASRTTETRDKAGAYRILASNEYKWDRCVRGSGSFNCCLVSHDHGDPPLQKISNKCRQPIQMVVRPSLLNHHIMTLAEASLAQPFAKGDDEVVEGRGRRAAKKADDRYRCRLRKRHRRPCRHSAQKADELASLHRDLSQAGKAYRWLTYRDCRGAVTGRRGLLQKDGRIFAWPPVMVDR
jgi:hypothetical protein